MFYAIIVLTINIYSYLFYIILIHFTTQIRTEICTYRTICIKNSKGARRFGLYLRNHMTHDSERGLKIYNKKQAFIQKQNNLEF